MLIAGTRACLLNNTTLPNAVTDNTDADITNASAVTPNTNTTAYTSILSPLPPVSSTYNTCCMKKGRWIFGAPIIKHLLFGRLYFFLKNNTLQVLPPNLVEFYLKDQPQYPLYIILLPNTKQFSTKIGTTFDNTSCPTTHSCMLGMNIIHKFTYLINL